MTASKFLCALVLLLAVSGTSAMSFNAFLAKYTEDQKQRTVDACGLEIVKNLYTPAIQCQRGLEKSTKTCPAGCKKMKKMLAKGGKNCEKVATEIGFEAHAIDMTKFVKVRACGSVGRHPRD